MHHAVFTLLLVSALSSEGFYLLLSAPPTQRCFVEEVGAAVDVVSIHFEAHFRPGTPQLHWQVHDDGGREVHSERTARAVSAFNFLADSALKGGYGSYTICVVRVDESAEQMQLVVVIDHAERHSMLAQGKAAVKMGKVVSLVEAEALKERMNGLLELFEDVSIQAKAMSVCGSLFLIFFFFFVTS